MREPPGPICDWEYVETDEQIQRISDFIDHAGSEILLATTKCPICKADYGYGCANLAVLSDSNSEYVHTERANIFLRAHGHSLFVSRVGQVDVARKHHTRP